MTNDLHLRRFPCKISDLYVYVLKCLHAYLRISIMEMVLEKGMYSMTYITLFLLQEYLYFRHQKCYKKLKKLFDILNIL